MRSGAMTDSNGWYCPTCGMEWPTNPNTLMRMHRHPLKQRDPMEESLVTALFEAYVEYLADKYGRLETKVYTQGVSFPSRTIHGFLNVMGKEVTFKISEGLLIHNNADAIKKELLHVEEFYKAQCPEPPKEKRTTMTVLSLLNALNAAIAENPSIMNARVLVDVDARKYDYHFADAGAVHVEDEIHEGAPVDKMILISLNQ